LKHSVRVQLIAQLVR